MAGEYKFHVRDDQNAQWVNILKDSQIEVVDENNSFPAEILYVSQALDWLALQVGGSNPGYAGAPIHCTDDVGAVDVVNEGASITTWGGIEVYKNLMIGGNTVWGSPTYDSVALQVLSTLDATTTTDGSVQVVGGVSVAKSIVVGLGITVTNEVDSLVSITSDTVTAPTVTVTNLNVSGFVNTTLMPVDASQDFGGNGVDVDTFRWLTGYFDTIDANNLVTSGDLTGATITATVAVDTVDLNITGNVTLDASTTFNNSLNPDSRDTRDLGRPVERWNVVYAKNITADSIDIVDALSGTFTGTFVGDLTGDVSGASTINGDTITATNAFVGDLSGNLIGGDLISIDGTHVNVSSGWDIVTDGNTNDALEVSGGASVAKNLTVGNSLYVTQDVVVTGSITSSNLDFSAFGDSIVPADPTPSGISLGSMDNRWDYVYATNLDVTNFTVSSVTGDLIGDVLNADGTVVLASGDDLTAAEFTGNVTGNLGATTTTFNTLSGTTVGVSGVTTTDQLVVTTSVNSNLVPDDSFDETNPRNIGASNKIWNNLYVDRVSADNVVASSFSGTFAGDLAGDLIGTLTTAQSLTVNDDLVVLGSITADSISFTNVESDIIGNILADDTTSIVLENGTDGTDAVFTGSVTGDVTGDLLAPTVNVTSTTDSTSWDNGALVVAGGVGIAGKLYVQDDIQTLGNLTIGGIFNVSQFSTTQMDVTGLTSSTTPQTGALVVTGGVGIGENLNVGGYIQTEGAFFGDALTSFNDGANLTLGVTDTLAVGAVVDVTADMTTSDITTNGDVAVTGATTLTGNFTIEDDTLSNTVDINVNTDIAGILNVSNTAIVSVPTGNALDVAGSIGTLGGLNIPTTAQIFHGDDPDGNWSGEGGKAIQSLIHAPDGGDTAGFYFMKTGSLSFGDFSEINANVDVTNQTLHISTHGYLVHSKVDVSSAITGADILIQNTNSGVTSYMTLDVTGASPLFEMIHGLNGFYIIDMSPSDTGNAVHFQPNTVMTTGSILRTDNGDGSRLFDVTGVDVQTHVPLKVNDTTQATDKDTGALIVEGGVGIEKDLFVGGNIYSNTLTATTFIGNLNGNVTGNIIGDVTGDLNGNLIASSTVLVNAGGVPTTTIGTGSLVIQGGTGGATAPTTGAGLSVEGSTWIGGDLNVDFDVTIGGDLTVNGTTTTIDTEELLVTDNMIELNYGLTVDPPASFVSGIKVNRGGVTYDDYYFMLDHDSETFRIGSSPDGIDFNATQAVATREDDPVDNGLSFFNQSAFRFDTAQTQWNHPVSGLINELVVDTTTNATRPYIVQVGDLDVLTTSNKNTIVEAINEVTGNGGTYTYLNQGAGTFNIDQFAILDYRSADYVITVEDPTANSVFRMNVSVVHDGTYTYTSEYNFVGDGIYSPDVTAEHDLTTMTVSIVLNNTCNVTVHKRYVDNNAPTIERPAVAGDNTFVSDNLLVL